MKIKDLNNLNIKEIKQIGPKRTYIFNKLGIFTAKDLLLYFPKKYLSLSKEFIEGEIIFKGIVLSKTKYNNKFYKINVQFSSKIVELIVYNQQIFNIFQTKNTYFIYGIIEKNKENYVLKSPKIFNKKQNNFAIYHNLPSYFVNKIINQIIESLETDEIIYNNQTLKQILFNIHNGIEINISYESLKYLEAQYFIKIFKKRKNTKKLDINYEKYLNMIPYTLSQEQLAIVKNLAMKLSETTEMKYFIYGEVGAGKTLICIAAILMLLDKGYSVTLISPTVSLAMQHYEEISKIIKEKIILYTSLTKNKNKEKEKIKNGEYNLIISTHALFFIEDIPNIGLVIIDEMHKFGVLQRGSLLKNAKLKNILLLSATPIPRTLEIMLNELMDYDTLPSYKPKNITTLWINENQISQIITKIKNKKCYWILPFIEDIDEKIGTKTRFEHLKKKFENVILIHGKMKEIEKIEAINKFKKCNTGILIATTIVEIGINVPNADIIIIESAERFGLSQLHQLRGRVGRNGQQAYCILLSKFQTKKIKYMKQYNNGFNISQKDLELRGSGKITGIIQHGCESFYYLTENDINIIKKAKIEEKSFENFSIFENDINY